MKQDIFAEFAAAEAELFVEQRHHGEEIKARAVARKINKLNLRRAKTEAHLLEILPPVIDVGESWHVISHGDVDALSYLIHIMRDGRLCLDRLIVSTWCMALPDATYLRDLVAAGRVKFIDFLLGEIFPASYPDEYDYIQAMERDGIAQMRIARNHSKIIAGEDRAAGYHFVIESSANINTNPRIEQTAIHASADLYAFYADFFAGIKSIDGARYKKTKAPTT